MLLSIDVFSEVGRLVMSLPIAGGKEDRPYIVRNIDGLSPVKADLFMATDTGLDGSRYQGSRIPSRNVVMTMGYNPLFLAVSPFNRLRQRLYEVFPPQAVVRLRFRFDDFPTVDLRGYVESHETSMFSQDPEVVISIICPEPYFMELEPVVLKGGLNTWVDIETKGNAPSGFQAIVGPITGSTSSISITSGGNRRVTFNDSYKSGDYMTISTMKGDKFARLNRDGHTINALDNLSGGDLSVAVDVRYSRVRVDAPGANGQFRIEYTSGYVGI